ncbi:MAG: imelysin family protein [Calditrichota bacterium]
MTFRNTLIFLFVIAGILLFSVSCSDSTEPDVTPDPTFDFSTILTEYADKVAVATYRNLRDDAATLNSAVQAFSNSPTQANLDAAGTAWIASRAPWESSEGFLFGPVDIQGLDPALDSWPVDRTQLDNVLASGQVLTPDFVANGLGDALKGFHTIEYLIFRDGAVRTAADVTSRETEYLVAATQVLADDTESLFDAWNNGFADEFKNAGNAGSRYQTQFDAVLEIVDGIVVICDEVANGKIADPFSQQDVTLVESQFSYNSLEDFTNNMRSCLNAYTGDYDGVTETGLNEFINQQDATLDARVLAEINAAIASVQAIPFPFRNNLNANTEITAAQAAINTIVTTMENDVRPLIAN